MKELQEKEVSLMDIPEMQDNKVRVAFTGFVVSEHFNSEKASEATFYKVAFPFGNMEVRYVAIYTRTVQESEDAPLKMYYGELSIVVDKSDVPRAMVIRQFSNDDLIEESLRFIQYEYTPYNQEGVLDLIRNLPHPAGIMLWLDGQYDNTPGVIAS